MIKKDQFYSYFWPAVAGLLIGVLIFTRMSPETPDPGSPEWIEQLDSLTSESWAGPVSYAQAVRRAGPSVVNIYTSTTVQRPDPPLFNDPVFRRLYESGLFGRVPDQQNSLGSGVIISREGYILTNQHVVNNADEIVVQLADGRQATAEIIGVDELTDLAVLRVPLDGLPAISLGDPNGADVGDVVLAIGNPFGVGQTVTQGIVSATGRQFVDLSSYVNFIQTDAAINQGNSGGALIDVFGNLIGINTAVLDGSVGVGLATPSDIAIKVLNDIVEHGHVVRGWLGISAVPAVWLPPELAAQIGVSSPRDVVVTELVPGGPAHRAGIEPGDILQALNSRTITDVQPLSRQIADTQPGERLVFDIKRNGEQLQVTMQTDALPESR